MTPNGKTQMNPLEMACFPREGLFSGICLMKFPFRSMRRLILSAALFALIAPLACPAKAEPIDVLLISANENQGQIALADEGQTGWPMFKAACTAQGIRVTIGPPAYDQLTPELFHKFQVIVVGGSPHTYNQTEKTVEDGKAFVRRIDDYHRAGGGLIFVPFGHDRDPVFWTESFGRLYDAQALQEKLYDPQHIVHVSPIYKSERCDYFWTDTIAAHPVTSGVRGLLLPRHGDYDASGTVPMIFGKSWLTLIRGAETTKTIGHSEVTTLPEGEYRADIKGTYDAAPEVVGVREEENGTGRMMVFPFHPAHTWSNFNTWILNGAMMLNGWNGSPSDGMKLFVNACRWVAEPANKAGIGGYVPPPEINRPQVTPIDWSKVTFPVGKGNPNGRDFKGIIGARTAYGDGSGTVADYAAAAKKLGLSFVIFLEDVQKIDAARYAKLTADCKAATAGDFQTLPGFLFRDTLGVEYYAFNTSYPRADQFDANGRIKSPNDIFIPGNNYAPGGIVGIGNHCTDPYFLLSYFTIAPYVYDNAKLVDNGLDVYESLQGRLHIHSPVSLTIVHGPSELAATAANAHLTVYHAEDMSQLADRLGAHAVWLNPVYITSGPAITRWEAVNSSGDPWAAGRERVRIALQAQSDTGIADLKIIEARTGEIFREFKPAGAKDFTCTIDETHKDQLYLIPVITDGNGRTAIGSTLETYQTGNRIWEYGDNVDSAVTGVGWDENHQRLKNIGGWLPEPFHAGGYATGDMPSNPFSEELVYHGVDGGSIGCAHCSVEPRVEMREATEPKIGAYYFENWLASYDDATCKYAGHSQFLDGPVKTLPGCNWISFIAAPQPMEYVDVEGREETVRARYHAPIAANINEVDVTFKKDCTLKRVALARTLNRVEDGPMYVTGKDQAGEWSALDTGGPNGYNRLGALGAGDYIFLGSDYSGAPTLINLGDTPISYNYGGMYLETYIDGKQREMKDGEKITARFMILNKPRAGQNNSDWIKRFIADYAIGGGRPGYTYSVSQGKVSGVNYSLNLAPDNGGTAVTVKKYNLPHNLLVKVSGMPVNAIAGRYDLVHKQLMILPVYENTTTTSINTTLGDTSLYLGELFHCDDREVVLSCVQDGADDLLLEVHNSSETAKKIKLTAVPGFTPLGSLEKNIDVPAWSSVKLSLPTGAETLVSAPYFGD